jgi:hypothetical protein
LLKKIRKRRKRRENRMALWQIVAKTELKRRTSGVRGHRIIFFFIIYVILFLWAFLLAPYLFNLITSAFLSKLLEVMPLSVIVTGLGLILEFVLMMFFLMIMMYPLQNIHRKAEIGYKEIVLASPIKPGDIFLGEYIGKLPFYIIFILIFAPIMMGIINPIMNLNPFQFFIIYLSIIGLVIFAALVGTIFSLWLEHKIAKSEKSRDLSKALEWILVMIMVVIMYSLIFLFNHLLSHPELKNFFMVYPSLWFSNIILYVIEPMLIETYFLNIWLSIIITIGVPLLVLFIAFKKADSFFSLEGGIEKISSIIEKENKLYGFIRKISERKWEGLIITQFKGFFRKKENIMKIIYVVAIVVIEAILFGFVGGGADDPDPLGQVMQMLMLILIVGMMMGILIGNAIFIGSKDLLWVYKRSPRGASALVYSYLRMMIILLIFMDIGFTILFSLLFKYNIALVIFFFLLFLIHGTISISQAVGIQCFNPAFDQKGGDMGLNNALFIGLSICIIVLNVTLAILVTEYLSLSLELILIIQALPLIFIGLGTGFLILYFGIRKLGKIE